MSTTKIVLIKFQRERERDREKIKITPPAVRYVTAKTIVRKLDVLQQNKYRVTVSQRHINRSLPADAAPVPPGTKTMSPLWTNP